MKKKFLSQKPQKRFALWRKTDYKSITKKGWTEKKVQKIK